MNLAAAGDVELPRTLCRVRSLRAILIVWFAAHRPKLEVKVGAAVSYTLLTLPTTPNV